MCVCHSEPPDGMFKSAIWKEKDEVLVKLSSRKNCQAGSGVLRRGCCCAKSPKLCPVHALWCGYLADVPDGTMPWKHVSPAKVLGWIRSVLRILSVSVVCDTFLCVVSTGFGHGRSPMRRRMVHIHSEGGWPAYVRAANGIGDGWYLSSGWQDLLEGGSSMAQILRAGQWKSAAFLRYLNMADVEKVLPGIFPPVHPGARMCKGAVLEVACDSEDEEWID